MKKEQIYVVIDDEPKRLRAIQILSDEKSLDDEETAFRVQEDYIYLHFYNNDKNHGWFIDNQYFDKTEIYLDQLEQMLNPKFVVKEIALPFEELQKQAEMHGWELVKKERQIKVGDFGKFWDYLEEGCVYGFIAEKTEKGFKDEFHMTSWSNFAHLTDEEKAQIQENW